jgi:hypothetical protein
MDKNSLTVTTHFLKNKKTITDSKGKVKVKFSLYTYFLAELDSSILCLMQTFSALEK